MLRSVDDIRQHNQEILDLAEVLRVLSTHAEQLHHNPFVCDLVNKFNQIVWMHLVFDDKELYADLLRHPDPAVAEKASAFRDSGSVLRKQFTSYVGIWCRAKGAQGDEAFVPNSEQMFDRIVERVRFENEQILSLFAE